MEKNDFKIFAKDKGISNSLLESKLLTVPTNMSPFVLEERKLNVAQMDVFSRLMMDRIIFLGTEIDDYVANIIQAQLLFLDNTEPGKPIDLYINSPGGSVYAGLGIYDTMQIIKSPVRTTCTGMAASMAAVLLVAGESGERSALKHSRVLLHQPMGGCSYGTQASDMEIACNEIVKLKNELYEIISNHTGQTTERVSKDSDRDFWLKSNEALDYGIIDKILTK